MLPHNTPSNAALSAKFHQRFAGLDWTNEDEKVGFALDLFYWQAESVAVYREFLRALKVEPKRIKDLDGIPYLPLSFFKSHTVKSWDFEAAIQFSSSTTTGQIPALHHIANPSFYKKHSKQLFEKVYGSLDEWVILALLPSYLERGGSSLVYMIDAFISQVKQPNSGFFLHDYNTLAQAYIASKKAGKKVILWGVSYALLDLAESDKSFVLQSDDVLMETGGMKGRRKEMVREELHGILKQYFGVNAVHSEYGMTEMLSQAYSKKEGVYEMPPSLSINIRDVNDPFAILGMGKTGGVNVMDLANIDSCAFLQTQDLGRKLSAKQFEILGRFDHSELRGCNLMAG